MFKKMFLKDEEKVISKGQETELKKDEVVIERPMSTNAATQSDVDLELEVYHDSLDKTYMIEKLDEMSKSQPVGQIKSSLGILGIDINNYISNGTQRVEMYKSIGGEAITAIEAKLLESNAKMEELQKALNEEIETVSKLKLSKQNINNKIEREVSAVEIILAKFKGE